MAREGSDEVGGGGEEGCEVGGGWERRGEDWIEGGGGGGCEERRESMGSDLGFGLRVVVSLFHLIFFFSIDRWIDVCGMERWMDGWMGAMSSIRGKSPDWFEKPVI